MLSTGRFFAFSSRTAQSARATAHNWWRQPVTLRPRRSCKDHLHPCAVPLSSKNGAWGTYRACSSRFSIGCNDLICHPGLDQGFGVAGGTRTRIDALCRRGRCRSGHRNMIEQIRSRSRTRTCIATVRTSHPTVRRSWNSDRPTVLWSSWPDLSGHSALKTRVNALMSRPSTSCLPQQGWRDADAHDKARSRAFSTRHKRVHARLQRAMCAGMTI